MGNRCPVCNSTLSAPAEPFASPPSTIHGESYSCPRCGDYRLEAFAGANLKAQLNSDQKIAVLSHWLRSRHEGNIRDAFGSREPVTLTDDLVASITRQLPPSPREQANKFVVWLGNSKHPPGDRIWVEPATHQSIMGATTPAGFQLVLHDLIDKGLLQGVKSNEAGSYGKAYVALSMDGWQHYDELRRGAIDSRKAFMAMQYGEEQLDGVVENTFKPAVKETGFDLFKLVDRPKAGLIDDRLRVEIQTSRFLIADLTHENQGAYWEAGFAEGLGKPVIYTCEEKKFEHLQTHFDTNHHLTIKWNADKPEGAAEELKSTIRATLPAEAKLTDD